MLRELFINTLELLHLHQTSPFDVDPEEPEIFAVCYEAEGEVYQHHP